MELPCAEGLLCVQTGEAGVGQLGAGQQSLLQELRETALDPSEPLPFPLRISHQFWGHHGLRRDCPDLLSGTLWLLV